MKKTLLVFTMITISIVIQSCKMEESISQENSFNTNLSETEKAAIDKAVNFLNSGNVQSTNSEWASQVVFKDAYPIYIEGIDEPSYYECKGTINGKDAGYVLINMDDTDFTVSEYSIDGITMTEQFWTKSSSRSVGAKIFRYSAFEYLAINNTSRGQGDVVASFGFSGVPGITTEKAVKSEDITKTRNEFKDNLNKYGTAVEIDKDIVTESNSYTGSRFYDKWTSDELNYTFAGGWHLPHWTQEKVDRNGSNVWTGCTPVAYAMIYAYWAQFKGADRLFGGIDLDTVDSAEGSKNPFVQNAILEIGEDLGTKYGTNNSSTTPGRRLETRVDNYGDDRGYYFTCDVDYGSEWLKGKHAFQSILQDKPLALSYREGERHHVAVEGVKYKERVRWIGKYNREMWYLCNWGHGNIRKWICTYKRFNASAEDRIGGVYHVSATIPIPKETILSEDFENGWNSWEVKHYRSSKYYNNSYRLPGISEGFIMRDGYSKALVIYISDTGNKAEDIFLKRDFNKPPTKYRKYKVEFNSRTEKGLSREIKVVITNGDISNNGTIQKRSGLEVYTKVFTIKENMENHQFEFTPKSTDNFKVVFYVGEMPGYGEDVAIDNIKVHS